MCKVSVIIPVYNAENYLKKCLESVINQTLRDIEIICIDDCSVDNSYNILEKYKNIDPRIVIKKNTQNIGQGITRNIGISIAKGQYIAFIDDDDWFDLDYLEKLYNSAVMNNSDVVFCASRKIHYEKNSASKIQCCNPENDIFNIKKEMMNSYVQAWLKLYKKDFIKNFNLKFAGNPGEDLPFAIYVCLSTNKISTVSDTFYNYLERENSTCRQSATNKNLVEVLQFKEIYKNLKKYKFRESEYKKYKHSIDARLYRTYKFILNKCLNKKIKNKLILCMYINFFPLMWKKDIMPYIIKRSR